MKVLSWDEFRSERASAPIAAVIGVFDGLHIGHRELVGRALGKSGLASTVITFEKNPKRLLSPEGFRGDISTLDQKLSLLESAGVDLCVLIDFSGDFSKLPGRQFLSMLHDSGDLRYLAVGGDFRCGHRLDTDAEGVRQFCGDRSIEFELLGAVHWAGHPVSSSRIRKAIVAGHLEDAAHMLGRPYEIDLRGAAASTSGRFAPTGGQACPPPGPYESRVSFGAGSSSGEVAVAAGPAEPPGLGPRLTARLGTDGSWSFPVEGAAARLSVPIGLRLIRRLSRD